MGFEHTDDCKTKAQGKCEKNHITVSLQINILSCILNIPDFKYMAAMRTGELVHLQIKSILSTNLTQ